MEALTKMVDLRGGLDSLGWSGVLHMFISWCALPPLVIDLKTNERLNQARHALFRHVSIPSLLQTNAMLRSPQKHPTLPKYQHHHSQ